jgi:hypothetical protein
VLKDRESGEDGVNVNVKSVMTTRETRRKGSKVGPRQRFNESIMKSGGNCQHLKRSISVTRQTKESFANPHRLMFNQSF